MVQNSGPQSLLQIFLLISKTLSEVLEVQGIFIIIVSNLHKSLLESSVTCGHVKASSELQWQSNCFAGEKPEFKLSPPPKKSIFIAKELRATSLEKNQWGSSRSLFQVRVSFQLVTLSDIKKFKSSISVSNKVSLSIFQK